MTIFIFIVVIATSIWVLIDAHILGVRKGVVKGLGDMGPFGWFFASLLLWIIAFPLYLGMRPKYVRAKNALSEELIQQTGEVINKIGKEVRKVRRQIENLEDMKKNGTITEEEFIERMTKSLSHLNIKLSKIDTDIDKVEKIAEDLDK